MEPLVGIIMGSKSDWETMRAASETLARFGVAHESRVVAANTLLPVLGVPVESHSLKGMDSLLSIVQMPGGIPVGALAIGKAGAQNAALLAVAILANHDSALREKLRVFREEQAEQVRSEELE